jgi:hypothetical protein
LILLKHLRVFSLTFERDSFAHRTNRIDCVYQDLGRALKKITGKIGNHYVPELRLSRFI